MSETFRVDTVDYRAQRETRSSADTATLMSRGFWLYNVPRLAVACRILGHKPVVDGYDSRHGTRSARWVACDRCGVRTEPQGDLDPSSYPLGQPWTGPEEFAPFPRQEPGDWPEQLRGTIGGQVVIGGPNASVSVELKIGNPGSEQVLAGQVCLGRLARLYLHTERHGTWLQRRLNPQSWESRRIGLSIHSGRAHWSLWEKDGSWSRSDPAWWSGSFPVDPRDIVLGRKLWAYETIDVRDGHVRMPEGDDHLVTMRLDRGVLRRARGGRETVGWTVVWSSRHGIGTESPGRGRIFGSSVDIPPMAAKSNRWPQLATARIAADLARDRAREGYDGTVTV